MRTTFLSKVAVSAALISALLAAPAQAAIIVYTSLLSGAAESPANNSAGTGSTRVEVDTTLHTMQVFATFSGLTGNTTASHIHCCTTVPGAGNVGVATELPSFPHFPLGVSSGTFTELYDLTLLATYNPAFVTNNGGTAAAAEAALLAGLAAGKAYLNIHTTFRPGGEIRGFLQVPEPDTLALMSMGLLALGAGLRRRRN